ncbi:MAG: LuxR family transcriptional regulator [Anaerolineaceae bacterium]|nr:LuxR family transcriptional regulator [Anaerolineaceae bacterium]
MSKPILATKLYIPPPPPKIVSRPRLIEHLNQSLHRKLTLVSAPAGFGKTTLVSEWVAQCERPIAWLSLDKEDNDPSRFLLYFITALQTVEPAVGQGMLAALQSPQPPPVESILPTLLNEITIIPRDFVLILDDYHVIDAQLIDRVLTFLLKNRPPQIHLLMATREDPNLPLARLRARDQLTELRAADLRFTLAEAAGFLNEAMALNLAAADVAALEARTEGWIAGLQLAALAVRGHLALGGTTSGQHHQDTASFIKSFTGSHRFVLDYLVEEVLQQQPAKVQTFLLHTAILDRMCGSLCDAVLRDPSLAGQATLEYLERANLFIVPLDHERRWYRYHHLFADLLRQRLYQQALLSGEDVAEYHIRASEWYEENGLAMEAFQHAAAANDVARAERLADGKGIPLHFSGGITPILNWLASLSTAVLNARPSLWWKHAALLLVNGQTVGVAEKLQAAETALAAILQGTEPDDKTRNLIGQIASAKATLALTRYDVANMLAESRRALEYLQPVSLFTRATANWTLGYAYTLQGNRAAARQSFMEAISLSQASGAIFTAILAMIGLGQIQEADNQLYQAAETYRHVLQLAGEHPQQIINEAHLGLARIFYEWNDLDGAEQHARQSLHLARQYESFIDRFINAELFLARLKLARGDVADAAVLLAQVDSSAREQNFVHRMPEITAVQVLALLRQGKLAAAAHLAQAYELPLSQARVSLAQGDPATALAVLAAFRQQVEARGWEAERLQAMILEARVYQVLAEADKAVLLLSNALTLAEPGSFIRTFVDEGVPMAQLLSAAAARGITSNYVEKLLAAFEAEVQKGNDRSDLPSAQPLIEPLSQRELEVLRLIAQGLSNHEIGERLVLALSTVKGHNQNIFGKLQVQRRTEAVARARELGLV